MAAKTIVLITGANTGIGYETVKALLAAPKAYHILVAGRSTEKVKNAISTLDEEFKDAKSTMTPIQIDVESDESISKAFEHVKSSVDHIDVLINNAGAAFDSEIASGRMTIREAWNKAYDVNVSGTQVMTTTFIPLLLKSSDPRLLFVTSGLSTLNIASDSKSPRYYNPPAGWPKPPGPGFTAYRSSKTALNMMMVEWDRILKKDGVKVWAISPGFLATGLGGDVEMLKKMGAGDPSLGGKFICEVVEGKRDSDTGKVVHSAGIQPW